MVQREPERCKSNGHLDQSDRPSADLRNVEYRGRPKHCGARVAPSDAQMQHGQGGGSCAWIDQPLQDCFVESGGEEKSKLLIHFVNKETGSAIAASLVQLGFEHRRTPPPPSSIEDEVSKWIQTLEGDV